MKNLLIGLGNPILGDDGVGWVVAKELEKNLQSLISPNGDWRLITSPSAASA